MNANALHDLLRSGNAPLLLDVLPEDIHAARRIPGSVNACVFEMVFLEKVAELLPSREQPVIIYGAGGGSWDVRAALDKLTAAGYVNASAFFGGLAEWEAAGLPLEGGGDLPAAPVPRGVYQVDTGESVIRWTGRNLFNSHHGTVRLASGEIHVREGVIESARFVIDLNTIACEDLTDPGWNAMLIRHLHDADFFQTAVHPTAEFIAERAEPIPGGGEGTPNYQLGGKLTLRGVTLPLAFPALIATPDGRRLTGQAQLEFDRTEFGSIYGSGKFFRFLGKHIVNDLIHLHLKIHADLRDA